MAVYFVLAVVGLALMLVSFLADDILDGVLDIDSGGLFSTTAAAAALTLFGAAGIISTGIGADARWAIPAATPSRWPWSALCGPLSPSSRT